jgi:hypothetical protein
MFTIQALSVSYTSSQPIPSTNEQTTAQAAATINNTACPFEKLVKLNFRVWSICVIEHAFGLCCVWGSDAIKAPTVNESYTVC